MKIASTMPEKLRKNASFLLFMFLLLAFRWSFADQYHVPTGSMEPTIHVGDRILVNKLAYNIKIPFTELIVGKNEAPARGDIVVFESPEANHLTLVKRLIGLPGDRVRIENGFVWINGSPLPGTEKGRELLGAATKTVVTYMEKIGDHVAMVQRIPDQARTENFEFQVPEGKYFFMGDNRDNSYDSRYWGFADETLLKGKALRVLYNFSMNGVIPHSELYRFGKVL